MRGTIDLEHHPFTGPSFSAASVFDLAVLLRGGDPLSSKDTPDFRSVLVLELLGQMVIVEPLVFPSG
jgi:hypothetical protein